MFKRIIVFIVYPLWPWGSFVGIVACIVWSIWSYLAATWDTPAMLVTSALWQPILVGVVFAASFGYSIDKADDIVRNIKDRK